MNSFTLNMAVQRNRGGSSVATQNIGTISGGSINASEYTFSSLEKNTRYVVIVYNDNADETHYLRRCFKTRGEFTNAEQNLMPDGTVDLGKVNRTGCFAVARTRQDITDCMCNGTRGGTRILAGQTTGSQTARQHWGCPDLDS